MATDEHGNLDFTSDPGTAYTTPNSHVFWMALVDLDPLLDLMAEVRDLLVEVRDILTKDAEAPR